MFNGILNLLAMPSWRLTDWSTGATTVAVAALTTDNATAATAATTTTNNTAAAAAVHTGDSG